LLVNFFPSLAQWAKANFYLQPRHAQRQPRLTVEWGYLGDTPCHTAAFFRDFTCNCIDYATACTFGRFLMNMHYK